MLYVEISSAPAAPTLTDTDPNSPANDNAPRIKGSFVPGTTIRLYTDAACAGAVAATGSAGAFATSGLAGSVADNSTTTFYATATDQAGNASPCSTSSITYVEDSRAAPQYPQYPPPPGPGDHTPPAATLSVPTPQKLGRSVRLRITCPAEPCAAAAAGTVRVPKVGTHKAKTYKLTAAAAQIAKGATATLKPRLSKSARGAIRRALHRGRKITVKLTIAVGDSLATARPSSAASGSSSERVLRDRSGTLALDIDEPSVG